jgi:hypothetical protein
MAENEGFLNRWSRRKLAEKERPTEHEEAALPPQRGAGKQGAVEDNDDENAERHPAEDIDIDALTPDSDFSIFMQKGVPAALKQRALRKLWAANPVYAGKEALSDMFDLADTKTWGLGPVRGTSWKIGQGYGIKDVLPSGKEEAPAEPAADEAVAEAETELPRDESDEVEVAAKVEGPEDDEGPKHRKRAKAHSDDEDSGGEPA